MPYPLLDETVPVTFGPQGHNGALKIVQDAKGRLLLKLVARRSPLESPISLASPPGIWPGVSASAAYVKKAEIGPTPAETLLDAISISLEHQEPTTSGRVAKVGYCLAGVNFAGRADKPLHFSAAGMTWSICLLEGTSIDTFNRIQEEGTDLITAVLSVEPVTEEQLSEVDEAAARLMMLLSFALGGIVRWVRKTTFGADDRPIVSILRSSPGPEPFALGPVPIDGPYPGLITKYLEWGYDRLVQVEQTYRMRNILHMLVIARNTPAVEIRALMVANIIELLRHYFSHNVLVTKGLAVEKKDDVLWPPGHPKAGRRMSLQEIMEALGAEIGVSRWETRFKNMRDSVVHTGRVPGDNPEDRISLIMGAMHYCDVVVLSILNWDGASGVYIPCNQPLDPRPGVYGNNTIAFVR